MMTSTTSTDNIVHDAELVAQSLTGNRDAFGLIVSRYQSLVCSIAYSATGCLSRSEDLAQETFLTAWKQLGQLREPAKLRAWLCGIARNLVNGAIRREAREPATVAEPMDCIDESPATGPLPGDHAISREEESILWRSLERIPEAYREPLVLYYREQQSTERVATALALSEEAVRQRLSRGRKLLHEQVLAFVEGALERSAPGKAFTMGVLTALPFFTTSAAAATVAATAAKGSALAKSAGLLALINVLLGPVVGFLGGYFGVRCGLAATRTSREREFVWKQTRTIVVGVVLFVVAQMCFLLLGKFWATRPVLCLALGVSISVGFATWLAVMIARYTRQTRLLRMEERKRHPELFQNEIPSLEHSRGEYRSRTKLFGVPLVHIHYGVPGEGAPDWAVGWIAVGDRAAGILFALGGMAVGGISVGTVSAGIISVGAVSVGLLAMGAVAVGGLAMGAMSFGLLAAGGFAVGWAAATGALAVAHDFAIGGNVIAQHANDTVARELFERYHAAGIIQTLLLAVTALSLGPVGWFAWRTRKQSKAITVLLCAALIPFTARSQTEKDWPMYNRDVLGTRHNKGETAIGPSNASQLVEKWRFPAKDSNQEIGVVHATPVVVAGCVYFGTATDPTFYKLSPDGKVRWSYRNPDRATAPGSDTNRNVRFQPAPDGIFSSALVTENTVFFGDTGGRFYALDRITGAERWKLNARAEGFPGAHPINVFMASPILATDKLIVAGGTLEQVFAPFPGYKGCTGRGFVMALEPKTGRILWKYDVGPKPEPLDPPITIKDSWGDHVFHFGPATSSVWSTPSFDAESGTIFFGTDVNTAPRRPTKDNPRLDTRESCAVIALNIRDGSEKWVTQINPGDIWNNGMRAYDPKEGRYKDLSIGDTPKSYSIPVEGTPTKVVGVGCKNGGFYVLQAKDGRIFDHTPIYTGPPTYPLVPEPDKRMLALPSCIGGLQTGCATDGTSIFSNGIDALRLSSQEKQNDSGVPPTGGRVVALSLDTRTERWRHERPRVPSLGGPAPSPVYKNVGDPVASGIAVANGVLYFTTVASGKLIALEAANGAALKEFDIGPVWSGPSISNGRVYVGTGNTLFVPMDYEAFFPKKNTGVLYSFGLPSEDAVGRLGAGKE